ncbi:hypothetical protein [uncultured Tateyamaria sp.]|uniref:hypothetical protein n=1 Tax=uncultured Tateyamaria sp. TaxID=455651 RepID=UPI00261E67CA|nr:hypothetical protein [uncultured Tateyamaria sp.]
MTRSLAEYAPCVFQVTAILLSSNGSTFVGGDDTISGSTRDDQLYGDFRINNTGSCTVNSGADSILGGDGNDEIYGEGDFFSGGMVNLSGGNDTMDGEGGTDITSYANATSGVTVDLAISGVGQAIRGGQGTDQLERIEGVFGSAFNDTVFAGASNDSILGGGGR